MTRRQMKNLLAAIGFTATLALGHALRAQTPEDEAKTAFAKAFALEDDTRKLDEAIPYYVVAQRLDPKAPIAQRATIAIARCQRKLGRLDDAQKTLDGIPEKDVADPTAKAERLAEAAALAKAREDAKNTSPDEFEVRVRSFARNGNIDGLLELGEGVIDPLMRFLEGEPKKNDANARMTAVSALLNLMSERAITRLQTALPEMRAEEASDVFRWLWSGRFNLVRTEDAYFRFIDAHPELLRRGLAHRDAGVRETAVVAAARMRSLAFTDLEPALADAAPSVRMRALNVISDRPPYIAADDLAQAIDLASKDESVVVRGRAAELLPRLRDAGKAPAAGAILDRLVKDSAPGVRLTALDFAKRYLDRDVRRPYELAAFKDPDAKVRGRSLGNFRATALDLPELKRLLTDENDDVRRQAAEALSRLPFETVLDGDDAEKFLVTLATESRASSARSYAISALAAAGSTAIAPMMTAQLQNPDSGCAYAAVYYVIRQNQSSAFPAILAGIGRLGSGLATRPENFTPNPIWNNDGRRSVVRWVIESNRTADMIALLAECAPLDSENRRLVAQALAVKSDKRDRDAILAALRKVPDAEALVSVIPVLAAKLGAEDPIRAFYIELLESPSLSLRSTLCQVIRENADDRAVPALIARLAVEREPTVRNYLTQAIAKLATAAQLEDLEKAILDTKEPNVAVAMIEAVGATESPKAVDVLLRLIEHPEFPSSSLLQALRRHQRRASAAKDDADAKARSAAIAERTKAYWLANAERGDREIRQIELEILSLTRDAAYAPLFEEALKQFPFDTVGGRFAVRGNPAREDSGPNTYHPALLALYDLGPKTYLDSFERILASDVRDSIKHDATLLLVFFEPGATDERLHRLLSNLLPAVQAAAAQAIGEALLTGYREDLASLVRSPEDEVRAAAEYALQRFVRFGLSR